MWNDPIARLERLEERERERGGEGEREGGRQCTAKKVLICRTGEAGELPLSADEERERRREVDAPALIFLPQYRIELHAAGLFI